MKKYIWVLLFVLLFSCWTDREIDTLEIGPLDISIENNINEDTSVAKNSNNIILKEDVNLQEKNEDNFDVDNGELFKEDLNLKNFVVLRDELLDIDENSLKSINCMSYEDIDLQNICKNMKNEKIVNPIELDTELLLDKKEFNSRFDWWDMSVCDENYNNIDDVFDCKVWIIISSDKTCEVLKLNEKETCVNIIESLDFIQSYNKSLDIYKEYNQYIRDIK